MTHLLDGNLLVALVVTDHIHHAQARSWFGKSRRFATCPITQGTLLRLLIREGASSREAMRVLGRVTAHKRHEFWPDDLGFDVVEIDRVVGHRQVTDAYLAQLARERKGTLATFDRGLCAAHPDIAVKVGSAT